MSSNGDPPQSIYTYRPLPSPNSIRLILIKALPQPSLETINPIDAAKISISLSTYELDNDTSPTPSYDALSYRWGNPMVPFSEHYSADHSDNPTVEIDIDGETLLITKSLADALGRMREKDADCRVLWVDAICINQGDVAERSQQVALMGRIYKCSNRVLVWLGDKDEYTNEAISLIKTISEFPVESYANSRITFADWNTPERLAHMTGVQGIPQWTDWVALMVFFQRPWFERVWIIQEVILGSEVLVFCGSGVIPWVEISRTVQFIGTTSWSMQLVLSRFRKMPEVEMELDAESWNPRKRKYHKLINDKQLDFSLNETILVLEGARSDFRGKRLYFEDLISSFRSFKATDPRDMVFSLLGIAPKDKPPFATHPGQLVPDYTIATTTMYTRVARMLLDVYGDLFLLDHVEDKSFRSVKDLPSWVPDYSVPLMPLPWVTTNRIRHPVCNANNGIAWRLTKPASLEESELMVQGVHLDAVSRGASKRSDEPGDVFQTWKFPQELANMARLSCGIGIHQDPKAISNSRFEIFWRTVLFDMQQGEQPAPLSRGRLFLEYLVRFAASLRIRGVNVWKDFFFALLSLMMADERDPYVTKPMPHGGLDDFYRLWHSHPTSQADYHVREDLYTKGVYSQIEIGLGSSLGAARRYFLTTQKRAVLGPLSARPGDEIWLLAGSPVPVVLRKMQGEEGSSSNGGHDCYEFMGQAFVYGVMGGEAMDPSVTPLRDIALC